MTEVDDATVLSSAEFVLQFMLQAAECFNKSSKGSYLFHSVLLNRLEHLFSEKLCQTHASPTGCGLLGFAEFLMVE